MCEDKEDLRYALILKKKTKEKKDETPNDYEIFNIQNRKAHFETENQVCNNNNNDNI